MAAITHNRIKSILKNVVYFKSVYYNKLFLQPTKKDYFKNQNVNKIISSLLQVTDNISTRCIFTSKTLTSQNNKDCVNIPNYKQKHLFSSNSINAHNVYIRKYSTESSSEPPKRTLPSLMEFPEIVWPSFFKSVRNWILARLIIRPYFDQDFSLYDFVMGSKKAVEVVSTKISNGELNSLDGLITSDVVTSLQKSISDLSLAQRQQLQINQDDIYFSFPYQVGIMFDESQSTIQRRYVEITMVYHVLRGLKQMRGRGEEPPLNVGILPEYKDKIFILNYRFIREFTKGVEDQWTINIINHFKPNDFI